MMEFTPDVMHVVCPEEYCTLGRDNYERVVEELELVTKKLAEQDVSVFVDTAFYYGIHDGPLSFLKDYEMQCLKVTDCLSEDPTLQEMLKSLKTKEPVILIVGGLFQPVHYEEYTPRQREKLSSMDVENYKRWGKNPSGVYGVASGCLAGAVISYHTNLREISKDFRIVVDPRLSCGNSYKRIDKRCFYVLDDVLGVSSDEARKLRLIEWQRIGKHFPVFKKVPLKDIAQSL